MYLDSFHIEAIKHQRAIYECNVAMTPQLILVEVLHGCKSQDSAGHECGLPESLAAD